jgi:glycosyltransferase 2 family protein
MKKVLQLLGFAGLGSLILYLVFSSQNKAFQAQCALDGVVPEQCNLTQKLLSDFGTVSPMWMMGVVVAFTFSNLMRAKRWQMQHVAIGYNARLSTSFWAILLGYFANLGFPRMGEVVRAGALAKAEEIPAEKVMGTLVVDRLMDFLCLFGVIFLAFVFEYATLYRFLEQQGAFMGQDNNKINPLFFIAGAGFATLAVLYALRHKIAASAIGQKVLKLLTGFKEGIFGIFKMQQPILFIALSLGIWLMFYLQCLFGLWAFPPTSHLTPHAALLVFVIGTFGFIIPSPGGMGTYHALAIAALSIYGVAGSDGFSYANISFFAIQIIYNIVGGLLALFLLQRLRK